MLQMNDSYKLKPKNRMKQKNLEKTQLPFFKSFHLCQKFDKYISYMNCVEKKPRWQAARRIYLSMIFRS